MKKLLNSILFLTCCLFTSNILASHLNLGNGWNGKIYFGYTGHTGNTRDNKLSTKLALQYRQKEKWQVGASAEGKYKTNKEGKSEQNAKIFADADYYFIPRQFGFTQINYHYDHFSPYIYKILFVVGYGWEVVKTKRFLLTFKAGPGLRHRKENTSNKVTNDFVAYLEQIFIWHITDRIEFKQAAHTEIGQNNSSYFHSKTSILTTIIGNLGLETSFELKHYSSIPALSKNKYKTDTETKIELVYSF